MRVKLIDQAKEDLADIAKHYRELGGATLARKMVQKIKKPTLSLKDNPHLAPPYELAEGVHRLTVADGLFYVFYRVLQDVEVLHIRRTERAAAEEF